MKDLMRTWPLLAATAVFAVVVVPVAIAGAAGDSGGPHATASASVKKKVKKLKEQVAGLEQRLAAVESEQGGSRPPTGNAGGDLTGSYPNPAIDASAVNSAKVANNSLTALDIGLNAVGPAEIQNPTRSVSLPLGSFVSTTGSGGLLDFTPSDGTAADFVCSGSCGFAPVSSSVRIRWDDDSDGGGANVADNDYVSSTFTVPPDYASGGSFAVRISKDGNAGIGEDVDIGVTRNGSFVDSDDRLISASANTSYTVGPDIGYAPGDSVSAALSVTTAADGVQNTYDDQVDLHSIEFRYTATQ